MRKLKSKRYLFIGGPSDRKRIPVGGGVGDVYVYESVDMETLYYSGKLDGIAPTVRHVYHRETYTVDGVETTAFIYDQLWKDRIKLIAHLLANYGKRKKYPRRSKPRIPIDMLYSSINPSDYIKGTISP